VKQILKNFPESERYQTGARYSRPEPPHVNEDCVLVVKVSGLFKTLRAMNLIGFSCGVSSAGGSRPSIVRNMLYSRTDNRQCTSEHWEQPGNCHLLLDGHPALTAAPAGPAIPIDISLLRSALYNLASIR
jgi:hypothetical protein